MRTDSQIPGKLALLIAFAAIVYLLGNARVALWDRDEPRYAQTSRQMLQSGDWIVPRLLDEPRLAKPIFIYWCQAAAMKLFGDNDFAARLPSSIAMTLTLALVALVTYRAIGPRRAGLLLYGLQVASANAKNVHVHANTIRSVSFTREGIPLATQEHGWDVEDIEEADRLAEEEEHEDE